jgi:hypothetical protein
VEQRLRVFQIASVEAFGEPAVDVGEHRARLVATALFGELAREARRRAQFPRFRAYPLRERDSLAEVRLGWFCLPLFEAQFPTKSENLGPVCRLIGIRPEALFDRFKRVGDGAFARLGFRQKPHKVSDVSVRSGLE